MKTCFAFLCCLVTISCAAPEPVRVKLQYTPITNQEKPGTHDRNDPASIITRIDIQDKRFDKDYLGFTDVPIYGEDVVEWMRGGIVAISQNEPSPTGANDAEDRKKISLNVGINRTSCRGTIMLMRCTVCIDVDFIHEGEVFKNKTYYGSTVEEKGVISQGTRHFGEVAVQQALNGALEEILVQLRSDLR